MLEILRNNFPNGIRDDIIDISKLLKLYSQKHPDEEISPEFVHDLIHENGIRDGDRFYFISPADATQILETFIPLFEKHSIIFYSEAIHQHSDLFRSVHIYSPQILRRILQELDSDHHYFEDFCSSFSSIDLAYEIFKFFLAQRKSLTLEEVQSKFQYVPREKIVEIITNKENYLPTRDNKFLPIANMQIDYKEIESFKSQIEENGCASLDQSNFSINLSINYELFEKDVLDLIFKKYLAEEYVKKRNQIYKRGAIKNSETSLSDEIRKFISNRDEISIDELFSFMTPESGARHMHLAIAFETMIRVNKNLFVKSLLINFDISGIDDALDPFVQNRIVPLKSVTSFTGFPSVNGFPWNLFLLESFLRKYSRRYSFSAPNFSSSNIGAIYPSSMHFKNYLDVQASVIVQEKMQEKIDMDRNLIADFLKLEGYRARCDENSIQKIIDRIYELKGI